MLLPCSIPGMVGGSCDSIGLDSNLPTVSYIPTAHHGVSDLSKSPINGQCSLIMKAKCGLSHKQKDCLSDLDSI